MGYIFDALNQQAADPHDRPPGHAGAAMPAAYAQRGAAAHLSPDHGQPMGILPQEDDMPPAPGLRVERIVELDEAQRQRIDDRVVVLTAGASPLSEEYRLLRTSLLSRWSHRRHLIHTITSATPQEGKTMTSLNLALSMAELRRRRTLVVEADLRLPTFGKLLPLDDGPGLVAYLRGEAELGDCIQSVDGGLHVLAAGASGCTDAVQLFSNGRLEAALRELRQNYDHVIIDTPPVIELADAGIVGALSDEVLVVARMQRTPRELVEQAVRVLGSYQTRLGGLIATDEHRVGKRYYYRYRYHYRYQQQAKAA